MPVWTCLGATLALNYYRHKKHQSTLCSAARKTIPPEAFLTGWAALTAWLVPHYLKPFKNGEMHA